MTIDLDQFELHQLKTKKVLGVNPFLWLWQKVNDVHIEKNTNDHSTVFIWETAMSTK